MKDKILIIEDSLEMRENTASLLHLAGYEVCTASNGLEGLMLLRKEQPDLILCDVTMPELDGYGVLRAVKNIPELIVTPFIFVTARSETSDIRRAMEMGADDYLVKPFRSEELLVVVEARLQKSKQIRRQIIPAENIAELMRNTKEALNSAMHSERKEIRRIKKKDMIYMEGDSATHLYLVISGKIKTYRANEWGKEYMTGIFLENDFFGHFAMVSESCRHESAMAMEDSEIAVLQKYDFKQLLASDKTLSLQFITFVMNSLDEAEQRMLKLAYDSARSRVAEALLFLFRKYKAKDGDTIPLSRENLSTLAGISVESASRNLSDFRDEGLIETYHGSVKVHCMNKLAQLEF